jgi:hypothetical protein
MRGLFAMTGESLAYASGFRSTLQEHAGGKGDMTAGGEEAFEPPKLQGHTKGRRT